MPHSSPCLVSLTNVLPAKVHRPHGSWRCTGQRRLSERFFRRVRTFTTGDWDSSNQAFTMSAGSNVTCPTASSGSCALLPACSCPIGLSTAGKLVAQTPPSSVSRLRRGYDDAPHGAHCPCEFPRKQLKPLERPLQDAVSPRASLGYAHVDGSRDEGARGCLHGRCRLWIATRCGGCATPSGW